MAKRESLYKLVTDVAKGTLTLKVGEAVIGSLQVEGVEDERNLTACLHGYKQKVADKGAKSADAASGKVDAQERLAAVKAEFLRLMDGGVWNAGGMGPGIGADGQILVAAFMLAKPDYTREQIVEKVKALSASIKTGLLTQSDVSKNPLWPYVEQARSEAAAKAGDLSDALAAFDLDDNEDE